VTNHLIGLLLGTEEDWPSALEGYLAHLKPEIKFGGDTHTYTAERIVNEPFDLRAVPRYSLVIDRLAYWYHLPREWMKKVALMDRVYLLNNPFTFQAMEKHAAYCAMIRLGLKVPETWMVPHKIPPDNPRFPETAAKYNRPFDLADVAHEIGYPLYMKPFDGGAWVGVSRVDDDNTLQRAYDSSGERLMHLQGAVEPFDVFVRSLSIGAETMVMHFDPGRPQHERYQVDHDFLDASTGDEVVTIGQLVNAFFRWEFNSCETLVVGSDVHPIDYANATPDVAITSLHYYFPWAIEALVKWSVFCTATGRSMRIDQDITRYLEVADEPGASYGDKLAGYRRLADEYFERERYRDFCADHLSHAREAMVEFVEGSEFDRILVETVRTTFPAHEHEQFVGHYRGLLAAWAEDQRKEGTTGEVRNG
jgi:hypothetical protein